MPNLVACSLLSNSHQTLEILSQEDNYYQTLIYLKVLFLTYYRLASRCLGTEALDLDLHVHSGCINAGLKYIAKVRLGLHSHSETK